MWLNTAKFIWPQEMGSEDRMSNHDSGRTFSQKVYWTLNMWTKFLQTNAQKCEKLRQQCKIKQNRSVTITHYILRWVVDDAKCIVVTRVCVCVCVCLSAAICPHYCTDPDVTWGRGRGCSLVVHYWAHLQSGHGLRCYGNITRTLVYAGCARVAD